MADTWRNSESDPGLFGRLFGYAVRGVSAVWSACCFCLFIFKVSTGFVCSGKVQCSPVLCFDSLLREALELLHWYRQFSPRSCCVGRHTAVLTARLL